MKDAPNIGRIVHYTLNDADVLMITNQRMAHFSGRGNRIHAGQVSPAIVVTVNVAYDESYPPHCNLQVFLDGDDSYWATSRVEGDTEGTWHWPIRTEIPR